MQFAYDLMVLLVRGAGLEPARLLGQEILSLSWLPVTPPAPGKLKFKIFL